MFPKPPLILLPTRTSQDGPFQRQEEETTIKGDPIETRPSILDLDLDPKLHRKTEQVKNATLVLVIEHKP